MTKADLILQPIENKIYFIRNQKVMLDSDLAEIYGVETRVLNQAVKRNRERFPESFMFQINENEHNSLRSQTVTLETNSLGSQIIMLGSVGKFYLCEKY